MPLLSLSPALLWKHFATLCQIPRASKQESAVIDYYFEFAKQKGWWAEKDSTGNLLIRKPASDQRYANSPKVVLQGHVDMVCQKRPHSQHDFSKDPIQPQIKAGWLTATDTTLGADNGIGVSAALAILEDPEAIHGDLEVLLTIDEEAGMGGVRGLQSGWLTSEYLLNLDAEGFGSCVVGCAGGMDIHLRDTPTFTLNDKGICFTVEISGLRGGHSGINIHEGRGNANALLAEVLVDFSLQYPLSLISFQGGTVRNAIAREAIAEIRIDQAHHNKLETHIQQWQHHFKQRFLEVDDHLQLSIKPSVNAASGLPTQRSHEILVALNCLPQGVLRQSVIVPNTVDTSCNLGVVTLNAENGFSVHLLARALHANGLATAFLQACAVASIATLECWSDNAYPAWTPASRSAPLDHLLAAYRTQTNAEMTVGVVHAGLETGLISEAYPHLQMVSFGATIRGAHSPDEMVDIESVAQFYTLLRGTLAHIATSV